MQAPDLYIEGPVGTSILSETKGTQPCGVSGNTCADLNGSSYSQTVSYIVMHFQF